MTDNKIQLKNENILKLEICTEDGESTGDFLEFDLEDIELPLKLQECETKIKQNEMWLGIQKKQIERRPDKKGKKLLSANQESLIKLLNEFYARQTKAWEIFLGDGAISKILCGRKPYYTMFAELNEQLMPLMPKIKENCKSIQEKIKTKYMKKETDVME